MGKSSTFSGDCYAPAVVLDTEVETRRRTGISRFGDVAEYRIELDYLAETAVIPTRLPQSLTSLGDFSAITHPRDWFDTAADRIPAYVNGIANFHPRLKRKQIEDAISQLLADRQLKIPDILTCNGVSLSRLGLGLVSGRNEFYEIKPDSDTGTRDGEEKLAKIPKLFRKLGLDYKPGDYYPARNPKELDLPGNRQFTHMARVLMRQYHIARVRVFLTVARRQKGLIQYKLCIEIETEDKRKQQALARAMSKMLYATYIVCHTQREFQDTVQKELEQELGDYSFEGEKFPRVRCSFNTLKTLDPLHELLAEAINLRGLGLPGESYILHCDADFYKAVLATPTPDIIGQAWASFLASAKAWVTGATGASGWRVMEPYVIKIESFGSKVQEVFPYSKEAANEVMNWIMKNSDKAVAIVACSFVLATGVVALFEAEIVGVGLLVESETGSILASEVTPAIGNAGRFAASETIGSQVFTREVAKRAAYRGLQSAEEVAKQLGGTIGTASNDVAWTSSAWSRPEASTLLKGGAAAAAAGFALMGNCNTAYAQQSRTATPRPTDKTIAQSVSGLYMTRALDFPKVSKPATYGSSIKLFDYAVRPVSELFTLAENPETIYVGRVELL
jgi:hypothetical protein